jgi:DNA-binding winged helix-turn-helix (wHTH) protein
MTSADVAVVRWPAERDRLERLRAEGAPRLVLVEAEEPPPPSWDPLEDWIRVPAPEADVRRRAETLRRRAEPPDGVLPVLDEDGLLWVDGRWVAIPPVEARLLDALLDRFGAVVSRDTLGRAGWAAGAPRRNALDVHILRLRRRLEPLGLAVRTVRSRGYLLERADDGGPSARSQKDVICEEDSGKTLASIRSSRGHGDVTAASYGPADC